MLHATDGLLRVSRRVARVLDKLHSLNFVAFCESVSVASRNEKCQTRRTVGFLVLALIGIPASTIIKSDLPRPI